MAPRRKRIELGRPATWDDLCALPDGVVGEIIAGELVVAPRPQPPHIGAASRLGIVLGGPFDFGKGGPGGWVILDEPRIRFGHEIRAPDLAGWRRERWPGAPRRGPITVAPDWVCEILSPKTERDDRTAKAALYATAKVGHLWLVSVEARTLEVYRLDKEGWPRVAAHADAARVRAEPFDAVELDLGDVWPEIIEEDEEDREDG